VKFLIYVFYSLAYSFFGTNIIQTFKHLKSVFVLKEKCVMNFKLPSKIDFVCGYLNTSLLFLVFQKSVEPL
jgi:hypothetical protein